MKEEAIVARDLVDHLWKDAPDVHWRQAEPALATLPPSDHVVHRPDLAYLNRSWIWAPGPDATSLGEVPRSLRHRLKLWLARLIMRSLDGYFLEERAFVERLVRFQNDVAKKSDQQSDEIRQVAAASRSVVAWMQGQLDELSRRNHLLHGLLESRIERLEAGPNGERKSPATPTCVSP
jgi:hypothetical protein